VRYRRVIQWKNRPCCNKVLYLVMKCFKMFYVSIYFYFVPIIVYFMGTFLPVIYTS